MANFRVLLVDDQREIRYVLRSGLQTLGQDIQVIDVPSGEEAILLLSRQPINLLITDVRLPGINGLELKERAQVRNPGLKVVLMTGMSEPKTRREVTNAGADAYFFKPIDLDDFLETVKRCLGLVKEEAPEPEPEPEPAPVQPESPAVTLGERLSNLRQDLNAKDVVLLNDNGEIVSQTGALPNEGWIPTIMPVFSAANKVDHLLGAKASDLLFFSGKEYDLCLAHVGATLAILVVLPAAPDAVERVGKLMSHLGPAVQDMLSILGNMGVQVGMTPPEPPAAPAPPPEEEIDISAVLPELDAIFGKASQGEKKAVSADDFWASLTSAEESVERSDAISYEQARQLGLAPDE